MTLRLTKSKYCKGINCSKALYLSIHNKDLASAPSPSTQLRFDEGNEVGTFAQTFFPSGVLIEEDRSRLDLAIEKTAALIKQNKVPAIFEATFHYENVLCRVDILRNNFDGTWDIFEVKSTKEIKEEHHDDVAIQCWVVQHSGLKIKSVFLRHINPEFRSPQWDTFFIDADLTDIAKGKALTEVTQRVKDQVKILSSNEAPHVLLGSHCTNPYPCEFESHCWKEVPKGSTLELYRSKKRFEIYYNQYEMIEEIKPGSLKLTEFQARQWEASTSAEPIADANAILKTLKKLKFPLYFFDFETVAPAIPFLDGMASYQRIPVQWSCHIVERPDAEVIHKFYLYDPKLKTDPRKACLESMQRLFDGKPGTIVAYHASFEQGVIRELAEQIPESDEFLLNLVDRFWDLEDIFQKYYYHRDMEGSCSIKSVLPHFAPDLTYKDLDVRDGGAAEALLIKLCRGKLSEVETKKARESLLKYCERDSLAMLVIYSKLLELVGETSFNLKTKRN